MGGTFAYLRFNDLSLSTTNLYRNLYLGLVRTGLRGVAPVEAYLRTFVLDAGWRFERVRYGDEQRLARIMRDPRYDVVGATAYLDEKREIEVMCRLARAAGKPLVLGGFLMSLTGEVGTALRAELFALNPELLIVHGAGMGGQFLAGVLTASPAERHLAPGVIWWDGGRERWNRPLAVRSADDCFDALDRRAFTVRDRHPYHPSRDVTLFLESGGCPYGKCAFCSRRATGYGRLSSGKLVEIVERHLRRGYRVVKTLEEDVLTFKAALRELLRRFPAAGLTIDGQIGTVQILRHLDLIEELLAGGVGLNVRWGAENGVDRVLALLGKDVTADDNYRVADRLAELAGKYPGRLSWEIFLIDLVPDMTVDEFHEHLEFVAHCTARGALIFSTNTVGRLYYFPGSKLYRECVFAAGTRPLPWLVKPTLADARLERLAASFTFRRELLGLLARRSVGISAAAQSRRYLERVRRQLDAA